MLTIKRKFLACMILSLMSYTCASQASGWLYGVEVGYGSRTHHLNTSTVIATPALAAATGVPVSGTLASNKVKFTDNGTLWGAVVGYEWDSHPMWLTSVELRFNYDNYGEEQQFQYADNLTGANLLTTNVKFDRGPMLEVSGRFGLKLDKFWTPYFRVGGVVSNDELQVAIDIFRAGAVVGVDSVSRSERAYGWLVGLGFEMPLFRDSVYSFLRYSVVRGEYNYVRSERRILDDIDGPLNGRYSTRPAMHLWKVALVFKPN